MKRSSQGSASIRHCNRGLRRRGFDLRLPWAHDPGCPLVPRKSVLGMPHRHCPSRGWGEHLGQRPSTVAGNSIGSSRSGADEREHSHGLLETVVFGIDHFLVLALIASLVPAWMPAHMVWAYLTGGAFIAAGITIATKWMDQWAAICWEPCSCSGSCCCISPGIAVQSHDPSAPDEWPRSFVVLALCAGSWICAWHAR
jgi:hypothetical protein